MLPSDADLNVAIDWLARVARGSGDLPDRLDRLARAFVTPPSNGARKTWENVRSLLGDVQYIVFNIPAHLAEEQRRHFVAVLKPLPNGEDYAWTATGAETEELQTCEVHIAPDVSLADEAFSHARLVSEWKCVWNDYAKLTYALEGERVFTWNQLLLHGCRDPQPLGLSWTRSGTASAYYVHADDQILDLLGIDAGSLGSLGAWNAALAALPARLDQWPRMPGEVEACFAALGPFDRVDLEASAAGSIYHLLRSYARWGGGAFLSIPVVLAAGAERTTSAVLSVCSDVPLSAEAVLRWRLLAESVLPVIASSELVTQFHLRRVAGEVALEQAEAWAHEVKNRTAPMIACLARASADDATLDSDVSRALHGALILNAVSYAVQLALGGGQKLQRLVRASAPQILEAVLQYLLNYHAASTRDVLAWSPRWSVEECVTRLGALLAIDDGHNLGERAQRVLVSPEVVYATALLREVVQNIRVNSAVGGDRSINITYALHAVGDEVRVELEQRQKESTVTIRPELGRGIQATNRLFGERLGLGYIEVDPIEKVAPPASAWEGWTILIRSRAIFAVGGTQ